MGNEICTCSEEIENDKTNIRIKDPGICLDKYIQEENTPEVETLGKPNVIYKINA